MTRKFTKTILLLFLLSIIMLPVQASAAESTIIDIQSARAMAIKNSRSMKNKILALDKKIVEENQKEDAYYGSDLDGLYRHKLDRLKTLQQQLEDLISDGADPALITAKQGEISAYEASINTLKLKMNAGSVEYNKDKYEDSKYATEDAERAKADYEEQLSYQVEQKYSSILQLEAQLELLIKNYELQCKRLEIERIKKELGMSTGSDIEKLAVDVSTLGNILQQSENTLKVAKWQLNDILGRSYDMELKLTQYTIPILTKEPTYEELLDKILKNNANISQMKRNIGIGTDRLYAEYNKDSNTQQLAKYNIQGQELALIDEEMKMKTKVTNMIADLKSKKETYQNAQLSYATAKNLFEWDKHKYELGLISKIQKDLSELNFVEAENKLYKAGHDCYLAQRVIEMAEKGILSDDSGSLADYSANVAAMQ